MDGLSLVANIIAVAQAAGATARGLEKLARFRGAPQQILQLINEVSDLRTMLVILRESLLDSTEDSKMEQLQLLIKKASSTMKEIDVITHSGLIRNIETSTPESADISWKVWLRKYGALQKVFGVLRKTREEITSCLTLLTATETSRIRINLQNIIISQEETQSQIQESTDSIVREVAQIKPSMDMIQSMLQQLLTSHGTPQPNNDSRSRTTQDSKFRFRTSVDQSCREFCLCHCHETTKANTPKWMTGLIGLLFISHVGIPVLRKRSCNETQCKRGQRVLLQVNYYFPTWLFNRMLIFRDQWSPYDGHGISVRTPRLVNGACDLFFAIRVGNLDLVRSLLTRGAGSPFDCSYGTGRCVLAHAAASKQPDMCELLLQEYADPRQTDQAGRSAIDIVWNFIFKSPNDPAVQKLRSVFGRYLDPIDDLQNRNFTILHRIVLGLTKNIDLNAQLEYSTSEINSKCFMTWTPLFWAVNFSNVGAIDTLLRFDPDMTALDSFGKTIFHLIAMSCSDTSPILGMIINNMTAHPRYSLKETINKVDHFNAVALTSTTIYNKPNQARLLLANGALPDVDEKKKCTPLLYAIQFNAHEILKLLLRSGARIDVIDNDDQGLLHIAALMGDLETLEILSGIKDDLACLDLDAKDVFGRTPLENFDQRRSSFVTHESEDDRSHIRSLFVALLQSIRCSDTANLASERFSILSDESEEEFFDAGSSVKDGDS